MGLNGTWVNVPHPRKSKINWNVSLRACVCTSNLVVFYPDNGEWGVLAAKVPLVTETVPLWCENNFKKQRDDHSCSQHWILFTAAFVMACGSVLLGSSLPWGSPFSEAALYLVIQLWPALTPTRLLCPWDSPGRNTGVGCHAVLQGIFPTQMSCIAGGFFTEPPTLLILFLKIGM